jgi:hypothetical protein
MYAVERGSRNRGEISLRATSQLAGVTAILQAQRNEVSPTAPQRQAGDDPRQDLQLIN